MSRSTATVFNLLALAVLAWLIADNGLPDEDELAIVLLLAAAPLVSLVALWRPARPREATAAEVLDLDDRLRTLEAAEQRRRRPAEPTRR